MPETIWFQGYLADSTTGDPLTAALDMSATLYAQEEGGTALWGPESHPSVPVEAGWFRLELGTADSLITFDSAPYYLELTVDGETIEPRLRLGSVPASLNAAQGPWSVAGTDVHRSSGAVGVGTASPEVPLHVASPSGGEVLRVESGDYSSRVARITSTGWFDIYDDLLQLEAPKINPFDFQFLECTALEYLANDVVFRVHENGDVTADGVITGGGADLAEMIRASEGARSLEPGDVVVVDRSGTRSVVRSTEPRSSAVLGVVSEKPGFLGSEREWDIPRDGFEEPEELRIRDMAERFNEVPVAVVGIVRCRVSAENGAIEPGDLLVTAATPGHAMRGERPAPGTILGKALGSLRTGTGSIDVLVTLQ
ncbi:MAG: hypothetical protein GF405_04600 [Candidatus Eisenbacteria bacterium]|nr:hypothetical protein [Candidatus Eisenbacteria bacterium]